MISNFIDKYKQKQILFYLCLASNRRVHSFASALPTSTKTSGNIVVEIKLDLKRHLICANFEYLMIGKNLLQQLIEHYLNYKSSNRKSFNGILPLICYKTIIKNDLKLL